jgi:hypothetical protein
VWIQVSKSISNYCASGVPLTITRSAIYSTDNAMKLIFCLAITVMLTTLAVSVPIQQLAAKNLHPSEEEVNNLLSFQKVQIVYF